MKMKLFFLTIVLLSVLFFNSCGILEMVSGTNFDQDQFAKARQAKIMELRLKFSQDLKDRLSKNDDIENADITITLDENMINKLLDQYELSEGKLDDATAYVIDNVTLKLLNGVSIATIDLLAHNEDYDVDVKLFMDCLISIVLDKNLLMLKLEPFNISPEVTAKGIYASAKDIIKKLIALNLSELGNKLPDISIPIDIENKLEIKGSKTDIKSKVNLTIINPDRIINYKLSIKEILFLESKIFIALNLNKIKVG